MGDPTQTPADHDIIVHASCVAVNGRAALIMGASGSGKSGLALSLMAFGADLVSDDRTVLRLDRDRVLACAPDAIAGLIEARGVGLLTAEATPSAPVVVAVDLDRVEAHRLPEPRQVRLLDQSIPLLHKVESPHFAPAVMLYLRSEQGSHS